MAGYVLLIGAVTIIAFNIRYFFVDMKSEENMSWLTLSIPFIGLFLMYLFIKFAGYL